MIGAFALIVALVIVLPVLILMSATFAAAALGHLLWDDAERRHEGSELIDLYH